MTRLKQWKNRLVVGGGIRRGCVGRQWAWLVKGILKDPYSDGNVLCLDRTVSGGHGCDIVLSFCRMLPWGNTGERVQGVSVLFLQLHVNV